MSIAGNSTRSFSATEKLSSNAFIDFSSELVEISSDRAAFCFLLVCLLIFLGAFYSTLDPFLVVMFALAAFGIIINQTKEGFNQTIK